MKTMNLKFIPVLFFLLFFQFGTSQTERVYKETDKDVQSFKNFFKNFDWLDYEESETERMYPCKRDGIPKLKRMRNPLRNAGAEEFSRIDVKLQQYITTMAQHTAGNNFDVVKEPKGSIFDTPTYKRDKMINDLQNTHSAEDFIKQFGTKLDKTRVEFTEDEKKKLKEIFEAKSYTGIITPHTISEKYSIGDCNYHITSNGWPQKIESHRVIWYFEVQFLIYCECLETSSSNKLRRLSGTIMTSVTSTWKDFGSAGGLRFTSATKPIMYTYFRACCGRPDPWFKDDDGYERTKPGYIKPEEDDKTEENDEEEEDKLKEEDKDCCYEEQANNTIGVFPILSFGNNLDDSTIGVSIEYLHNMGNSFGNNEWFAGLEGTFATSSAQEGEIKENYYSGTAIVENRTPILPCVQWVQRVAAEYGKGTFEAFGNEEDFTNFTVGVNTGFNFDLSSNVSVAVDANIFEIGGQTFTPMTGPEIETDITNLNLPPTRVRFGFRFRF